ncbi:4,5-DOPA dioxygenase extradiol [Adhaeribacter aquaticus]|uniref:4,5-DOPA-extradiol-dioxygenase n=1 Tax=Adhaeribacter aquaticus TaxID=299567 RepID=UPI0003F74CEF|nr:4,5-DOPA dioxygenase extradiol [Adhaeribacter aquaticus]
MNLKGLDNITKNFTTTEAMPVLFVGHGSPMNAIEENTFAQNWQQLGKTLPKPTAILCISAHWQTRGTFVTAAEKPETIHDFGGFPQALFDVQYQAPGSLALAQETQTVITSTSVGLDYNWGLDHGSWSILKHFYPKADIPVVEMSLDYTKTPQWHYELAKELATLRRKGVLILGSGNIVHNLRMINWNSPNQGFDWAVEANEKVKSLIQKKEHKPLAYYSGLGTELQLAIPTPEHFLPLLYTLGLQEDQEKVSFFNDETIYGSISMTSLKIDKA